MLLTGAERRYDRKTLGLFGLGWAAFAAYCVSGVCPPIDLAGHAAQMQTLVSLLRGDESVARVYEWHFVVGYGLDVWLGLPLAFAVNGAFAAKVLLWLTMLALPIGHLALARAWGRSDGALMLAFPLVFSMSYWWGLLSGLMAQALFLWTMAHFVTAVTQASRWRWLAVSVLSLTVMQAHLITFAALAVVMTAVAWWQLSFRDAAKAVAIAVGPALLIALPRVLVLSARAVDSGPAPETQYAAAAHFNWFFKHYVPEGKLAAVFPAVVTGLELLYLVRRRKSEPASPAVATAAMGATYVAMPKTLSGILLVFNRLASLVGLLSLHLVSFESFPRLVRRLLVLATVSSLAQTAWFHHRFAQEMAGFEDVAQAPPTGQQGYLSLEGRRILGSNAIYLEHVGQWATARHGGLGHNFFAEYDHHAVRFVAGKSLPNNLMDATPEERAQFFDVLVFGEGPLPAPFDTYVVVAAAGRWRRLSR